MVVVCLSHFWCGGVLLEFSGSNCVSLVWWCVVFCAFGMVLCAWRLPP